MWLAGTLKKSLRFSCIEDFRRWEAKVWDMEALGSESGGKLAVYRHLKDLPAAEPYPRANLPVRIRRV